MASCPDLTAAGIIFGSAERILLIKENYGRRRYGPPGGTVEAGESPRGAVVREIEEETCVRAPADRLIPVYYFRDRTPWMSFVFRCHISEGEPVLPSTGEIAEVGWFDSDDLPSSLTHVAPHAISDALAGEHGPAREFDLR